MCYRISVLTLDKEAWECSQCSECWGCLRSANSVKSESGHMEFTNDRYIAVEKFAVRWRRLHLRMALGSTVNVLNTYRNSPLVYNFIKIFSLSRGMDFIYTNFWPVVVFLMKGDLRRNVDFEIGEMDMQGFKRFEIFSFKALVQGYQTILAWPKVYVLRQFHGVQSFYVLMFQVQLNLWSFGIDALSFFVQFEARGRYFE